MIKLQAVFWLFVFIFGLIGATRGWLREVFVTASLVLAFVIVALFFKGTEPMVVVTDTATQVVLPEAWAQLSAQLSQQWGEEVRCQTTGGQNQPVQWPWNCHAALKPYLRAEFWKRTLLLLLFAFIGYQTAGLGRLAGRTARTRKSELVLGALMGAVNGYLLVGSLWFYLVAYDYPVRGIVPDSTPPTLLRYMFPALALQTQVLGVPLVFIVLLILFVFLLAAVL